MIKSKKYFSILMAFLTSLFIFLPLSVFALEDERIVVDEIEATSENLDSIPEFGAEITIPKFTVTKGDDAYFATSNGGWYKKVDENWEKVNGNFTSGTFHYNTQVRIDENGTLYRLDDSTTVKVNDEEWVVEDVTIFDEYSYLWVTSKEYTIEEPQELHFNYQQSYDISTNYVGKPIESFSVAASAEGGLKPYVFSKVSGPEWLVVSENGTVSGTPSVIGENEKLVIRVTDASENYKDIEINVAITSKDPNTRTEISLVEADANNFDLIPTYDNVVEIPEFSITEGIVARFATNNGGWYKKVGDEETLEEGLFGVGTYFYKTQVRIDGVYGEDYKFADNVKVKVNGKEWKVTEISVFDTYSYLWVTSPEYSIKGLIGSIELSGLTVKPNPGDEVIVPDIVVVSANGDETLKDKINLTIKWQKRTGNEFFDWEDASGEFEYGQIYHLRLLLELLDDNYELENVPTFPVTIDGRDFIQFQKNEKTVGVFSPECGVGKFTITFKPNGAVGEDQVSDEYNYGAKTYLPNADMFGFEAPENKEFDGWFIDGDRFAIDALYVVTRSVEALAKWKYTILVTPKASIKNLGNNTVYVDWDDQDLALSYDVYRSTDKKKWSKITSVTDTEYTNSGLTFGTTYYYKIMALNETEKSNYSNIVSMKIAPDKVENVRVTNVGYKNIKIAWDKEGATGYEVYRSTNNKKWKRVKRITKNSTLTFNNTRLTPNKTYYYKVRAYKTVKGKKVYGPFSNVIKFKTAPRYTRMYSISVHGYESLKMKFRKASGATRYDIYRSTSKKGTYVKVGQTTSLTYYDHGLTAGKTYYYKVKACNNDNKCSPYSNILRKKVLPATPNLSLASTVTKLVNVTVKTVDGADGYEVFRATSKNGRYTKVKEVKEEEQLVFDNGTSKGKTYYYKVRAYTLVNGKKVYSSYSSKKKIKSM